MAEIVQSKARVWRAMQEGSWIKRVAMLLYLAGKDFARNDGPQWAAAIAYYALLSTLPLILASVAILSYFVDAQWVILQIRDLLGSFLPADMGRLNEIVNEAIEARGTVSVLSILGFLWTGTRVFGAAIQGMNVIYGAAREYNWLKRFLLQAVMLLVLGTLFLLAFAAQPLVRLAWNTLELEPSGLGFRAAQYVSMILLLFVALLLAHRYVPRCRVTWRAALLGAVINIILFAIAQPLFSYYVQSLANYNLIYGSLAIAIILIFWAWIFGMILLFSGEVAAHVQAYLLRVGALDGDDLCRPGEAGTPHPEQ
jgi:membrane protein